MTDNNFNIIYRQHGLRVFYEVMKIIKNREEAEDVCADVFLKLWETEGVINPAGWLLTCSRNAALNHLKVTNRTSYVDNFDEADSNCIADDIRSEYKIRMLEKIDLLPEKCRQIFLLCIAGQKIQEIADTLRIDKKTVLNQKYMAIKKLKIILNA